MTAHFAQRKKYILPKERIFCVGWKEGRKGGSDHNLSGAITCLTCKSQSVSLSSGSWP